MSKKSPIASLVATIKNFQNPYKKFALTYAVRRTVKFVGTPQNWTS